MTIYWKNSPYTNFSTVYAVSDPDKFNPIKIEHNTLSEQIDAIVSIVQSYEVERILVDNIGVYSMLMPTIRARLNHDYGYSKTVVMEDVKQ